MGVCEEGGGGGGGGWWGVVGKRRRAVWYVVGVGVGVGGGGGGEVWGGGELEGKSMMIYNLQSPGPITL